MVGSFFLYTIPVFLLFSTYCNSFLEPEHKVQVDIDWLGGTVPSDNEELNDVVFMTSADKERYQCVLPSLNDEGKVVKPKRNYKGQTPLELLKSIFSQILCPLKIDSFWMYELCHGYYIRQFHEEVTPKGTIQQEYFLGKFDLVAAIAEDQEKIHTAEERYPTIQVEDSQLPYFAINMTDGTFCALSGKNRFARILYVCHHKGNNGIYSFRETSTCEYEIVVLTYVLCLHPAFQTKNFMETSITCYSLGDGPMIPKRLAKEMLRPLQEDNIIKPESFLKRMRQEPEKSKKDQKEKKTDSKQEMSAFDKRIMNEMLSGEHCLRGGTSWWRYEFCYGKQVQQYHLEPDSVKTAILLGVWDVNKHLKWLKENPSKRPKKGEVPKQVSHFYADGQFCEEVDKPRNVEVKLRCKDVSGSLHAVSLYLVEPKTCEYILTIESSIFCHLLENVDENGLTRELRSFVTEIF